MPSIKSIFLHVLLRWAGYVSRMEDLRMPKAVFFSELQEGKRDRGSPRKRYKDQLQKQLAQAGISHQSWQQEASDQDRRRSSVRKANRKFEAERREATGKKTQEAERACSIPIILGLNLRLSKVQWDLRIKNRTLRPPTSMQEVTISFS